MEEDKDKPFEREPWQRLLRDRAGAPSETTDARIRAAARRALAPRAARWWLPASLAASFLLAVLIVQWQYGDRDTPAIVTESDLAAPAKTPTSAEQDATAVVESSSIESASNAQLTRRGQAPRAEPEFSEDEFAAGPDAEGTEGRIAVTGSRIGGPEQDLKAASEVPAEEASDVASPPLLALPAEDAPAAAIAGQAEAARERESAAEGRQEVASGATYQQTTAKLRKPEEWYAEIKKLRAAGRIEEADRELERLKAAYPGWLERHLQEKR